MLDINQLQEVFGFTRQEGLLDALEMPVMGEMHLHEVGRYGGLRMIVHNDQMWAVNMYDFEMKVMDGNDFFIVNARSLYPLNKAWEKAYGYYSPDSD